MISSIIHIDQRSGADRPRRGIPIGGFTLVEVMVALTLSMIVLAGVMSSFLMVGRTSMNVSNYSVAEAEIRRAVEEFSQDVRMARDVKWNSATSITLTVPYQYVADGNQVTYAFDAATKSFYRQPGGPASTAARTIFVRELVNVEFSRFNRLNLEAATDPETKRVQVTMTVRRTRSTLVAATTALVSASFTLRNKPTN
jgi:Tfp pilus assembly protein PilW